MTETYSISPTSNQIVTIASGGNTRGFSYLPTGQAQNDTRDSTHAYIYSYNQTGRLTSATLNGSTVGTYLVNGLEQRVVKTANGTTTHFVFDWLGHLLAEANGATGATLKEYIWLDDLPVAMVDDSGLNPVIYYIHADHLGTPQKITDSTLNIVWDGQFDPFGDHPSISGSVTNNLRFPGQYLNAETGLAQNWNRDYDASIGRYGEADPIGIAFSTNLYNYSSQNPLRFVDPFGLWQDPTISNAVRAAGLPPTSGPYSPPGGSTACLECVAARVGLGFLIPGGFLARFSARAAFWAACYGVCHEPPTPNPPGRPDKHC